MCRMPASVFPLNSSRLFSPSDPSFCLPSFAEVNFSTGPAREDGEIGFDPREFSSGFHLGVRLFVCSRAHLRVCVLSAWQFKNGSCFRGLLIMLLKYNKKKKRDGVAQVIGGKHSRGGGGGVSN